ncbi:hypothetical protein [Streptomyces virginiae]|uniref:hypothetical protein n=1 Tax=Streptomyces virginiae TaxID=1961 RepID=UPI003427D67C
MAEIWDEQQLLGNGFERVYAELERYDGPHAGLADVDGVAHYFQGYDFDRLDDFDEYSVWPAGEVLVALEREQWAIFARWNRQYEAGMAKPDSHPGHGGIDARYDELTARLAPHRAAPVHARRLVAEWRFIDGPPYRSTGSTTGSSGIRADDSTARSTPPTPRSRPSECW